MAILLIALMVISVGFLSGCTEDEITEPIDTDGDGYLDDIDAFPNDIFEWQDADNDGVGDNSDDYPNNPDEQYDSDKDGIGNNADAFPYESTQWLDRDGDGYGDNQDGKDYDVFPDNPNEWKDNDKDGIGDNSDFYDEGNGGIKIGILEYQGDNYPDDEDGGIIDPYFILSIGGNNSGPSMTYVNQTEILNPESHTVDVDDDVYGILATIGAFDDDTDFVKGWSGQAIDLSGDNSTMNHNPAYYARNYPNYFRPRTTTYTEYTNDGRLDLNDEMDAYMVWYIQVVEV